MQEYGGNMFCNPEATGIQFSPNAGKLLTPTEPTKVIALWNNFHALGDTLNLPVPEEPLYLLKAPNSFLATGETLRHPRCAGKVVFEGELGIVIGKTCSAIPEAEALGPVSGYTAAHDVTVADTLNRDASFAPWSCAKGFHTFCPMGPVVAPGLDPATLSVTTMLNSEWCQHFPVSDMRFPVAQLVSLISFDMTLFPGDVILCGTSVGVGSIKPACTVEVEISAIGKLGNRFG